MNEVSKPHSIAAMRGYAERSKKLAAGDKTEDELLQRVWNLAGDVTGLIEQLETAHELAAAVQAVRPTLNYYIGPGARTLVSREMVESYRRIYEAVDDLLTDVPNPASTPHDGERVWPDIEEG